MGSVWLKEQGGYIQLIQISLPNTSVPDEQRSRQRRYSALIFILQGNSNDNSCR